MRSFSSATRMGSNGNMRRTLPFDVYTARATIAMGLIPLQAPGWPPTKMWALVFTCEIGSPPGSAPSSAFP